MSGEDRTITIPADVIPGMSVKFSAPISPEGKGIEFQMPVDALIPLGSLNERLDVIGAAIRRQAAIEELPIVKQSLRANQKLLVTARRDRDKAQGMLNAKVVAASSQRRIVDATKIAPQDVNAVAQHDQRILQIEGQIEGAKERIPYLEALIGKETLRELFPDDDSEREAAD